MIHKSILIIYLKNQNDCLYFSLCEIKTTDENNNPDLHKMIIWQHFFERKKNWNKNCKKKKTQIKNQTALTKSHSFKHPDLTVYRVSVVVSKSRDLDLIVDIWLQVFDQEPPLGGCQFDVSGSPGGI